MIFRKTRNRRTDRNSMDNSVNTYGKLDNEKKSPHPCSLSVIIYWLCIWKRIPNWILMKITSTFTSKSEPKQRTVYIGTCNSGINHINQSQYPRNIVRNQKFNFVSFVPLVSFSFLKSQVLIDQFKFFHNLYFLILSLSQLIPIFKVGSIYTYWGPLCFVLLVVFIREGFEDFLRYRRDKVINNEMCTSITSHGSKRVFSSQIQVGDIVRINKNDRIPADLILLQTSESSGNCYIRTDQLDGETDWKLRTALHSTQQLNDRGKVDKEVNNFTKLLFAMMIVLSFMMICFKGLNGDWFRYLMRFIVLFSYLIPITLRINMDMAKLFYCFCINHDKEMKGVMVRSTTVPEELGRVTYLLTDKTGTLTKNDMIFKKLHTGLFAYGNESMEEISNIVQNEYNDYNFNLNIQGITQGNSSKYLLLESIKAISICHNVTPVSNGDCQQSSSSDKGEYYSISMNEKLVKKSSRNITYQASSPDEIALVKWTESVGVTLVERGLNDLKICGPYDTEEEFKILNIFPFKSESKRMGIIVQSKKTNEIMFYLKGADTVMIDILNFSDWLDEECTNISREGLRTLIVGRKSLTLEEYNDFHMRYKAASLAIADRIEKQYEVMQTLERGMQVLCITGVEDQLQQNVCVTLESIRNAGIKIWMLTGDKMETASCIATSSRLIDTNCITYYFNNVHTREEAHKELQALRRKQDSSLVILGSSIEVCLEYYEHEFLELATKLFAVVVCRCSPTQKSMIVRLLKHHTKEITCAIGDGGNDVSMIQESHCGIGIVGKEGMQASLSSDFSITQFSHISRLLLLHGRYSYKRSADLSHFVIHRGLLISCIQAIFSSFFYYASIIVYPSILMVGFASIFTNFPVFAIILDRDITPDVATTYPELYKELTKGRSLNCRTFLTWSLIAIYQACIIMYGSYLMFESEFSHIVSITFTALMMTEMAIVAVKIQNWHWLMVGSILLSICIYIIAMTILSTTFDVSFLLTFKFAWKVLIIIAISSIPLYIIKIFRRYFRPSTYSKLNY
ncbi:hypothetical protein A3Q56_06539 [Intoshia linei]|uniref:Phospholipid-transporting ATPase n=1 Tax=Intoshia linei TaxID=1819745 RepID=A0A177AV94_9BILA|nr:hypothetical protein A3Q56_06539 [Intoshia linei]